MNLSELKMTELREYAKGLGVPPQQHESRESLLYRLSLVAYPEPQEVKKHEKKETVLVYLTPDAILKACDALIKKGVEIKFDDDSWMAKFHATEDSGSLTMPLALIVSRVGKVATARIPRFIRNGSEMDGALA